MGLGAKPPPATPSLPVQASTASHASLANQCAETHGQEEICGAEIADLEGRRGASNCDRECPGVCEIRVQLDIHGRSGGVAGVRRQTDTGRTASPSQRIENPLGNPIVPEGDGDKWTRGPKAS